MTERSDILIGREIRGVEVRCDRCGAHKFYNADSLINPVLAVEMDGWEKRCGKHLCSDCVAIFDELTERFFKEIIY